MSYSNEISIDCLTKLESRFPSPEENKILVMDGMGFEFRNAKELFPAALLCPFFKLSGFVEFTPLFRTSQVPKAFLFDLPEEFSIRFDDGNRLYQDIFKKEKQMFYVFYSRDYDSIRIELFDLIKNLESLGLKIPQEEVNQNNRTLWRYTEQQDWAPHEELELPIELKNNFHKSFMRYLRDFLC